VLPFGAEAQLTVDITTRKARLKATGDQRIVVDRNGTAIQAKDLELDMHVVVGNRTLPISKVTKRREQTTFAEVVFNPDIPVKTFWMPPSSESIATRGMELIQTPDSFD
jgi:hypothetical protein